MGVISPTISKGWQREIEADREAERKNWEDFFSDKMSN
jgi:hypothetical protein